jgi:hypothetical protein
MPHIANQSQFQKCAKPPFCYLCGELLANGTTLNDDHCPPEGMFAIADRVNYPIKFPVHATCNHRWHVDDEKMAIFYDILQGGTKASDPAMQKKLSFLDIENDQGVFLGITNFPIRPLAYRVIRCAHSLLYGEYLPAQTINQIHYPIPEVDRSNGNRPVPHEMQTYQFANELCIAQKTKTHDSIAAYNHQFRYVCTWSHLDGGAPICIFAFDIYRLSRFAVGIQDFPKAVIGFYSATSTPKTATKCSNIRIESTDEEILYPILES